MLIQELFIQNNISHEKTKQWPHTVWQMAVYCSIMDGSTLNIHHTALTWLQMTFVFLVLWRTILVVTDTRLMWKCRKLSHSGFKVQNSVMKADIHWQQTQHDTWSFFCFLLINVIWNEKLLNRQKCTVFYSFVVDCHNVLIKAVIFRCVWKVRKSHYVLHACCVLCLSVPELWK